MSNLPEVIEKKPNVVVVEKGGSGATKTAVAIVGVSAVLFFGNRYLQKMKENNESDTYTDKKLKDKKGVAYSPSRIAGEYKNAMGSSWIPDGTSVHIIMDLADKSKGERWAKISKAYRSQNGNNLLTHLRDELKEMELRAFNSVVFDTKSKFKYGSKEVLSVKDKSAKHIVFHDDSKKWEAETFFWNGNVMGVVTARGVSKNQKLVVYKMSKYPNFWFKESDLIRYYKGYFYSRFIK